MLKHRYECLLNSLATMAREPSPDGSFQVSKLQPLKTLFCDLEAYRAFVALVLTEVQAEVEQSAYSPLIPLEDKIRLFEQVRQAVAEFDGSNVTQLKELGQQLYNLQPGFKRVWVHSSRRKGRDRQLLLLEYAVKSLVADRAGSGFQLVCHYLSTVKEDQFKFAPNAGERLSKIESFWKEHPPRFTEQPVRIIKLLSSLPPLPPHLELVPKPPPESEAAQAAERIKREEQCYQPGDWVIHESFGRGMVTKVKDAGRRVTIKFIHRSPRELLTTVAPMWPIPEPDKDDSALPELSPVVLEVLHHAKKPTEGILDDDELEELDDQVEVKLAKAAYNLAKAKKHFTTFIRIVGCTRFYEAGDDLSNCITRLKGAKNRICEAWLFRNGYTPNEYDDRHTLAGRFATEAPRALLRKAELLEQKLTLLFYGDVYTDDTWDGVVAPPEQRLEEVAVCLAEVENFYLHIKHGNEFQLLRWERNNDFQPGQWVLTLSNQPIMYCERNLSLTRWLTHEKLVVAVNGDEVVLRTPYRRRLERISADSLFLRPLSRSPVDMTTGFMERRTWFDLRPQLRQVPLELPSYSGIDELLQYTHDFGASLYFTCPCCGYPIMRTHPDYSRINPEDDYGFYEICPLCDWADTCFNDDGFDENDPDDENFNYTLVQARRNFEEYGSIFRPTDGVYYECHQSPAVRAVKEKLRCAFDAMVGGNNQGSLFLLWWQAEGARRDLMTSLKAFEDAHPEAYSVKQDEIGDVIGRRFDYKWQDLSDIIPGTWIEDLIDGRSRIIAVHRTPHGSVATIRNSRRELREISGEWARKRLEGLADNFWAPFYARRTWFESHNEFLRGLKPCPCCGYPELTNEGAFECCSLCCWEDDGQDDHNADKVLGGPNGNFSLSEARRNFEKTLCMFRPDDPELTDLKICRPENLPWKHRLIGLYDQLITVDSATAAETLWEDIERCWRELRMGEVC